MADLSAFSSLPDDARLWIHASTAPLSDETQATLLDRVGTFLETWTSHEHAVRGAADVLYDRFLAIAAIQANGGEISGCGKDDLARAIDEAAGRLGLEWVPSLHVLYRNREGTVTAASRRTFQTRASEGKVTPDTRVFDPSLTTLGALRDGQFEQSVQDSWHAQLLQTPSPSR